MEIEQLGQTNDFIYKIHGALPKSVCDDLIEYFHLKQKLQYDGFTTGGFMPEIKNTRDLDFSDALADPEMADLAKHYDEIMFSSLGEVINAMPEKDEDWPEMCTDFGYKIQRYAPGQYYHWHHDAHSANYREMTMLWYLNDVPKGNGGATQFKRQNLSVQPEKGNAIVFPATWTHVHRAETVKKGEKYIATTWTTSLITNKNAVY